MKYVLRSFVMFHTIIFTVLLFNSTVAMAPDNNSTISNEEQEALALAKISLQHSGNSSRNDELYRDLLNNATKNHYYQLSDFLFKRIKQEFAGEKFFKISLKSFFSAARSNNINFLNSFLDVNPGEQEKSRALHGAAQYGHIEAVRLLLERGASLEWRAKHGETALSVAIKHDQENIFKYLLTKVKKYKDAELVDFDSHRPHHFPDLLSWVVMLKNREKYLELLLHQGANPNLRTDVLTPLMYASTHNFTKSIDILLRYYADPNIKTATSANTALMFAARQGHVEAAKELLLGATSPAVDNALQELRASATSYFSMLPADLRGEIAQYRIVVTRATLTNNNGKTALDIAHEKLGKESDESKRNQFQALIALLQSHAARELKDKGM